MREFIRDEAAGPIYKQIEQHLSNLIADGSLPAGTHLPPTRSLAEALKVSRNSVLAAYESLANAGVVEARGSSGTYVRPKTGCQKPAAGVRCQAKWDGSTPCAGCQAGPTLVERLGNTGSPDSFLSDTSPAFDELSAERFRTSLNYTLTNHPRHVAGIDDVLGYRPLRRWLASYMAERGVHCTESNVLMVDSFSQTLTLLCRAFLRAGDTVLVQNPCKAADVSTLYCMGIHLSPIHSTADGLCLERLEETVAEVKPRLAVVSPLFHDPTGATMSPECRKVFLECAERNDFMVLENGFTDEYCYSGRLIPPLKAQDTSSRVVYASSFSRLLFPEVRVGWVVVPDAAVGVFGSVMKCMDMGPSAILQAACYDFCKSGYLEAHTARIRRLYRSRREALMQSLIQYMPPGIRWQVSEGGWMGWVRLPRGLKRDEVWAQAREAGVHLGNGQVWYVGPYDTADYIRLSYSNACEKQIAEDVRALGSVIAKEMARFAMSGSQAIGYGTSDFQPVRVPTCG